MDLDLDCNFCPSAIVKVNSSFMDRSRSFNVHTMEVDVIVCATLQYVRSKQVQDIYRHPHPIKSVQVDRGVY